MRNLPTEGLQPSMLRLYQTPVFSAAVWQTGSAFGLYIACIAAMYAAVHVSVWLTLALALPASGLIVRIFMLQHDCGHNSLFPSHRLNRIVGLACSLVTLTPFVYWRRLHVRHHKSWNDLDNRGIPADFFSDCLTLAEYNALRPSARFLYRVSHHPVLIHLVLPPVIFILLYRLPFDTPASFRRERRSVYLLNTALIGMFAVMIAIFGVRSVALVQLPAMAMASIAGIWLFAVQHRFENAQWTGGSDWNFNQASLHATSYLKLPRVLRWFSANIGLHHIHHLRPGIPNYRLQACQDNCFEEMKSVTVLTLYDALKAPSYALWDEASGRMVPFPS